MQRRTEFLDPARKLVDEVADWLLARAEPDAAGARSLAHLMVVVPTAQSGRALRLRLAQRMAARHGCGVLPPRIVLPMQVIAPKDSAALATATPVQLRAAFLKFAAERPRRRTEAGRTVLLEWSTLFRAEYVADVRAHLSFFDQLLDIWRILAGGGLLMSEVARDARAREVFAAALGDEQARWEALGAFETAFFDFLHAQGLRHEAEAIHAAKTAAADLPPEIREVVLPALADPVSVLYDVLLQQRAELKVAVLLHATPAAADRFDAWGRPRVEAWTGARAPRVEGIRDADVVRTGTDTELAQRLAADFPPAASDLALPALGLCDESLYPELAAAFLNAGYELHNPERHALAASSLGRLVDGLAAIHAARDGEIPWETFAAVLRLDDTMTAVLENCPADAEGRRPRRTDVLRGLDVCRNAFLPRALPARADFDLSRLKPFETPCVQAFQTAARAFLAMADRARADAATEADFLRNMLQAIFARRTLGGDAAEFRAAAEKVRELLEQLSDARVGALGLPPQARAGLLRKMLAEATYSLEPDSPQALKTEGWLELAWSAADKVALAGFSEGAVPDAVVGHPFLPDSLRAALDLTTNARRLARDTFLLADLLAARSGAPGSVRAYLAQTNNAGEIRRPSRLLFLVDDGRLAARARALFGDLPPGRPLPGRRQADAWRPRLPSAVAVYGARAACPDGRLTASAVDAWLKCPFTYLLKYGLGMNRVEEKTELEANDFGTVVHLALERYAREQLARTERGLAQLRDADDIARALVAIMAGIRAGFGANPSVNMRLQLDAAEERLKCFARIQARWAEEGWQVAAEPEYGFTTRPFAGEGAADVHVKGSVDRIDWKEGVGYRLIDYKTWDRRAGAAGRILGGGAAQCAHAARLGLPLVDAGGAQSARKRFLSVQLPLYGRCLETVDPRRFHGQIADYCYVLLGATAADAVVLGSAFDQGPFEAVRRRGGKLVLASHLDAALETARRAVRGIRENLFWPPGPTEEWKWEMKDVLFASPEADFPVGTPWRDAQEAKLAARAGGEEVPA